MTLPTQPPTLELARQLLRERFGFPEFRDGQEAVIRDVLARRDVVAVMPTGAGKSICYQLPALLLDGLTLVVSPLIALMKDQVDRLVSLGLPAAAVNSSLAGHEQLAHIAGARDGRIKLLYVAPERFKSQYFRDAIAQAGVSLLVVDEAHCISQWGHDFRPDYRRLAAVRAELGNPPTAALTATATPEVQKDIAVQLAMQNPSVRVQGFHRPNLFLAASDAGGQADKVDLLKREIRRAGSPGIVYCSTRKNAEAVAMALNGPGSRALLYHAGLPDDQRTRVQETFMTGKADVVVATNAFGMGVDKADLRFVIHYNLPRTLEAYYQEVGRAGRDGKPSRCLLLFNPGDVMVQRFLMEGSHPPEQLVRDVHEAVLDAGIAAREMTLAQIARLLPGRPNERGVGTALQILEDAGHLRRMWRDEHRASIRLLVPVAEARGKIEPRKRTLRTTFEGLANLGLEHAPTGLSVELGGLAANLSLTEESLRDGLAGLHDQGLIEYRPPFRGRGVELVDESRATPLRVDFEDLGRRARREEQKLQKMVTYATMARCRGRFILDHFGDPSRQGPCGCCDLCTGEKASARHPGLDPKSRRPSRRSPDKLPFAPTPSPAARGATSPGSRPHPTPPASPARSAPRAPVSPAPATVRPSFAVAAATGQRTLWPRPVLTQPPPPGPASADAPPAAGNRAPPPAAQPGPVRDAPPVLSVEEQSVATKLRALRMTLAEQSHVPPYIVFNDRSLTELVKRRPSTPAELEDIHGFGPTKTVRYGLAILDLFRAEKPPRSV